MVSCSNCATDAQYTYKVSEDLVFNYCASHLPRFLTAQKNAGFLKLMVPAVIEEVVTSKPVSKKKTVSPTE